MLEPTHPPARGYGAPFDADSYERMVDKTWTDRGQIPPSHRVIAAGKDVTEQPVETWPAYYRKRYAEGWRPWLTLPDGSAPKFPTIHG